MVVSSLTSIDNFILSTVSHTDFVISFDFGFLLPSLYSHTHTLFLPLLFSSFRFLLFAHTQDLARMNICNNIISNRHLIKINDIFVWLPLHAPFSEQKVCVRARVRACVYIYIRMCAFVRVTRFTSCIQHTYLYKMVRSFFFVLKRLGLSFFFLCWPGFILSHLYCAFLSILNHNLYVYMLKHCVYILINKIKIVVVVPINTTQIEHN